MFVINKLIIM